MNNVQIDFKAAKMKLLALVMMLPLLIMAFCVPNGLMKNDMTPFQWLVFWIYAVCLSLSFVLISCSVSMSLCVVISRFVLPIVCVSVSWFLCFGSNLLSMRDYQVMIGVGLLLFFVNLGSVIKFKTYTEGSSVHLDVEHLIRHDTSSFIVKYLISLSTVSAIVVFGLFGGIIIGVYKDNKVPPQREMLSESSNRIRLTTKQKNETTDYLKHVLTKSAHNPKHFEILKTDEPRLTLTEKGERLVTIKVKYRGENGFGALRIEEKPYTILENGMVKEGEAYEVMGEAYQFKEAHPELFLKQ